MPNSLVERLAAMKTRSPYQDKTVADTIEKLKSMDEALKQCIFAMESIVMLSAVPYKAKDELAKYVLWAESKRLEADNG